MEQRRMVIKIGGRAFADKEGFRQLARGILSHPGVEVIIVHGGGAEISQALKAARRPTQFVDGIRVTRAEDIRIVDQVLSENVNSRIAGWLENSGLKCRRMAGKSHSLLVVAPLKREGCDFGYVGEVVRVNPQELESALAAGKVPVISPISADAQGMIYNVNADDAAAALAAAVKATDLVFITDVPGVRARGETCARLELARAEKLTAEGIIQGGMVAKINAGREALIQGVPRVHIIAWEGETAFSGLISAGGSGGTVLVC